MRPNLLALLTVLLLFAAPYVKMPPDELRGDNSSKPMASSLDVGNFSSGGYHLVTGEWWESSNLNSSTALATTPIWASSDYLSTFSIAWGDMDGDVQSSPPIATIEPPIHVQNPLIPSSAVPAQNVDASGNEWLNHGGFNWYRVAGSGGDWIKHIV